MPVHSKLWCEQWCTPMKLSGDWFEVMAIGVAVVGVCGGLLALYYLGTQV